MFLFQLFPGFICKFCFLISLKHSYCSCLLLVLFCILLSFFPPSFSPSSAPCDVHVDGGSRSLIRSFWLRTSLENFLRLCLHLCVVFIARVRIINAVAFCYCCCSCCRCFLARVCVLIATDAMLSREKLCLWHCCSLSCVRL